MQTPSITTALVQSLLPDHYLIQLLIDPTSMRIIGCTPAGANAFAESESRGLVGLCLSELITPEKSSLADCLSRALTRGHHLVTVHCSSRSGSTWVAQMHIAPVACGEESLIKLTLHDNTAQLRTETALRETQRALHTLISNLPGFVYRCANDPQWTMLYISEGCQNITGYRPNDFIGNRTIAYNDIILPEHGEWARWQQDLLEGKPLETEYRIRTADGEIKWVWERGRAIFNEHGTCLYLEGFVTDITSRKQIELELRTREELYRHLFELSPASIVLEDDHGYILDINEAYCRSSGYARDELVGKNIRVFVPAENHHIVDENIALMLAGATLDHEVISQTRTGERRRTHLRERAVPLPDGKTGILSLATNVEEQRRAVESLHRSEKRYRSLVENLLEGMAIVDFSGKLLYWNPSALRMFGIEDVAALPETHALDWVHPQFLEFAVADMGRIQQGQDIDSEYQFRKLGGQEMWLETYGTRIDYEGTEAMLLLMRDVTQRKEQEALREYLSWHDPLTHLYNRNYFEKVMGEGSIADPAVIAADLNGLKLINDTLGHSAGDQLLRIAADLISQHAPPGATCARIGGDEFAVIVPSASLPRVENYVRDLNSSIQTYNQQAPQLPLSIAVGYKVATCKGQSLHALFKEADDHMYREKLLQQRSSRSSLVHVLMGALESKNYETREHVERMGDLALALAKKIGYPEAQMFDLSLFSKFHDIGKVGVADSILQKPSALTPGERAEMQRHCEIGYRIAIASPELAPVADFILKHHEWFNGKGYPLGLSGTEIPLPCRIVAIADAFDAMTSDRPYRKALTREQAAAELRKHAGTQFDPDLVGAFLKII